MHTDSAPLAGDKVLLSPDDQAVVDRFAAKFGDERREVPQRIMIDPDKVGRDLARLVLGVIELLSDLMERQAVRRVESGALSEEEIERLGQTLLALEVRLRELKAAFGLENQDLTLNLGLLRDLISDCD